MVLMHKISLTCSYNLLLSSISFYGEYMCKDLISINHKMTCRITHNNYMQFKLGKISITLLNKVRNEPLFAFNFPFTCLLNGSFSPLAVCSAPICNKLTKIDFLHWSALWSCTKDTTSPLKYIWNSLVYSFIRHHLSASEALHMKPDKGSWESLSNNVVIEHTFHRQNNWLQNNFSIKKHAKYYLHTGLWGGLGPNVVTFSFSLFFTAF